MNLSAPAHQRDVGVYLGDALDELADALRRGDREHANVIAAMLVGLEKQDAVRGEISAREQRWRELRVRCRFPSARQVRDAVAECAAIPPDVPTGGWRFERD